MIGNIKNFLLRNKALSTYLSKMPFPPEEEKLKEHIKEFKTYKEGILSVARECMNPLNQGYHLDNIG